MVIVNWNSNHHLKQCLQCLQAQSRRPTRIIVVDNASTDSSLESIVAFIPEIILIKLAKNIGFAAANNLAVERYTECEWIALLNPDAFPAPDWLEKLLQAAHDHPDYGFFASRLLDAADPERLDGAGDVCHISGLVWRRGYGCAAARSYLAREEIFSSCAAAALYRRSAFIAAGGFDARYFCYSEDVDLGFRLRLQGQRCLYVPEAQVRHVGSASSGRRSDFTLYHGHRNYVWTYVKNMPTLLFWAFLLPHILLNLVSIVWFTLSGRGRVIVQSKRDALKGVPSMWKQREMIQRSRRASLGELWKVLDKRWSGRRGCRSKEYDSR